MGRSEAHRERAEADLLPPEARGTSDDPRPFELRQALGGLHQRHVSEKGRGMKVGDGQGEAKKNHGKTMKKARETVEIGVILGFVDYIFLDAFIRFLRPPYTSAVQQLRGICDLDLTSLQALERPRMDL